MPLTENFKKEAVFTIEGFVSHLKKTNSKELLGVKKIGKYTNPKDFWHGYFLGTIEGQLMKAFFHDFNREMTHDERIELDRIISFYDVYLLDAISKIK